MYEINKATTTTKIYFFLTYMDKKENQTDFLCTCQDNIGMK